MKSLVAALLAAFASGSAFALENENIVKQLDGKGARCQSGLDLNHRAYLPSALSAGGDASTLSVAFVLHHYLCGQSRAGFGWETSPRPLDPYYDRDLDDRQILIKLSEAQAVLARAGEAGALSVVDVENAAEQTIQFSAGVSDLLASAQLAALEAGSVVEARATFFVRMNVAVETAAGETVNLGQRGGGAYTIFLTLRRDAAGAVQVLGVRLN